MRAVVFRSDSRGVDTQYASLPTPAIERGCSIGANHALNCRLPSSIPATRIAIARFGIIRARFDKRSAQAFPKADHRLNIRNALLPKPKIDEICFVCREANALPNGELSMKTPSLW